MDLAVGQEVPFAVDPMTGAIEFEVLAGRDYQLISLDPEPGDFDRSGLLDSGDIDLLSDHVRRGLFDPLMDLNADSTLDGEDYRFWVHDLSSTYFGDADLSGEFNGSDMAQVFAVGKYEIGDYAISAGGSPGTSIQTRARSTGWPSTSTTRP